MTDEADVWKRFTCLLPTADADEVQGCRGIGEQEAGLDLLVGALLKHQVPLSETTRAEISVVAETWGVREAVSPRLLDCPGDGLPAALLLVEGPYTLELIDPKLAGFLLVPWIRCTASGRLLIRAHAEEPWGLSLIPEHYAVLASEQGPSLRLFDSSAAWEALQELAS
ncbi:hypothetical protein OG625_26970 [Streptomyces sp. NBC_01351]|uniref:hypothetical protein n=1 Tax=Streptomyces sp. NBC_01351 TaxID=2903833 RepID=UPI002E318B22|nr:hypothetical protein [Streptomyces sp. NBC_01351]